MDRRIGVQPMKPFIGAAVLITSLLWAPSLCVADSGDTRTSSTNSGAVVAVETREEPSETPSPSSPGTKASGPVVHRVSPYSSCETLKWYDPFFTQWKATPEDLLVKMDCIRKVDANNVQFLVQRGGAPPPPPQPPPPPSANVVAALAQSGLTLALPEVSTAPPEGGIQLVGVDIWFWVTNSAPTTATATVPGLSATVIAAPTATHLAFADGTTVDCAGGGVPYDASRPGAGQSTDCRHAFNDRGTQKVDVTVDWTLTWTATDGQAGVLPAVPRTTTLNLPIQEGQAVTT